VEKLQSMKRIGFLFCLVLGAVQPVHSQGYLPLLEEGNHWDVAGMSGTEICWYLHAHRYRIEGDTVINGDTLTTFSAYPFQTANGQNPFCPPFEVSNGQLPNSYYLKEDVENRRVYRLINGSLEILYDFSLEVGDILELGWTGFPEGLELLSIDTVTYSDGIERRRFVFDFPESDTGDMTYVEGMGGTLGLFNPFEYSISEFGRLMCFAQNENVVYDFDQCSPWATGVSTYEKLNLSVTYSSENEEIILSSDLNLGPCQIQISDSRGRVIANMSLSVDSGSSSIPVSFSVDGIYIAHFYFEGGAVSSSTFYVHPKD
jgi:hypothetical protein